MSMVSKIHPGSVGMRASVLLAARAVLLSWVNPAEAVLIVDQQNLIGTGGTSAGGVQFQSFRPVVNNIAAAAIAFDVPDTGTLTLRVFDDCLANGGAELASGMTSTTTTTDNELIVVDSGKVAFLTPGQEYFLKVESSVRIAGKPNDPYAQGLYYVFDPGVPFGAGDWDLVFQTFADSVSIPEPTTTMLLVGGGLLLLNLRRFR